MKKPAKYEYQFPEKNPFRAKEVTEPEFLIQSREDWFKALWVDFTPVRSNKLFERLKFDLGIVGDELANIANDYSKIIFSGHRGSGKSVELRRFSKEINHEEAYWAIFIDLEQETETQRVEPEDLFIILTTVVVRQMQEAGIPIDEDDFNIIAEEWLQETEVEKELKKEYGLEAEAGASVGWSFWKLLSLEGGLKGVFSQNNTTTRTIRQKVRLNQKSLIEKLNVALIGLRQQLMEMGLARDLLFIIDGLEKARREVYETLFVKDPQFILGLNAHLICCVPIDTFYEIQHQTAQDIFRPFYLPMIRRNNDSQRLLKEMVTRRVDKSLFAEGVLENFIHCSGGCPRQLLKLVNHAIVNALGQKVDKAIATQTIEEMGNEKWRGLTTTHKEILNSGQFENADKELLELLYSLNLLEYNGAKPERRINPLLERFFKT